MEKVFNIFNEWRDRFVKDPYPALDDLYEKDKKGVTVRQELMERLDSLTVKYAEKKSDDLAQLKDRKLTGWVTISKSSTSYLTQDISNVVTVRRNTISRTGAKRCSGMLQP